MSQSLDDVIKKLDETSTSYQVAVKDEAIRYKGLYQEAEKRIANIKEIGFDTSLYEQKLGIISDSINGKITSGYRGAFAEASYRADYTGGIQQLNSLLSLLDKYNVYYRVFHSCELIDSMVSDKEITIDELREYTSQMMYNLKLITESNTMNYEEEKHIVEKTYELAFRIIEREVMMTGESRVYNYVMSNELNLSYFDILMKKRLADVDFESDKAEKIKRIILNIRKEGIDANTFDIALMKEILMYEGKLEFINKINKNVNEIVDELDSNHKKILNLLGSKADIESDNNRSVSYKKSTKQRLAGKLISLILTSSLIAGGVFGLGWLAKKITVFDKYNKKTETYSTIDDENTVGYEDYEVQDAIPEESVVVKTYLEYDGSGKREYLYYDLSNFEFDELVDYYNYCLNEERIKPIKRTIDNKKAIPDYNGEFTEVIKKTYEEDGQKVNWVVFAFMTFIFEFLYGLLWLLIEVIRDDFDPIVVELFNDVEECLNNLKNNQTDINEELKKLFEIERKLKELLDQNEALKNLFDMVYEANRQLLTNPEELHKKVEELMQYDEQLKNENVKVKKR